LIAIDAAYCLFVGQLCAAGVAVRWGGGGAAVRALYNAPVASGLDLRHRYLSAFEIRLDGSAAALPDKSQQALPLL